MERRRVNMVNGDGDITYKTASNPMPIATWLPHNNHPRRNIWCHGQKDSSNRQNGRADKGHMYRRTVEIRTSRKSRTEHCRYVTCPHMLRMHVLLLINTQAIPLLVRGSIFYACKVLIIKLLFLTTQYVIKELSEKITIIH